MSDDSILETRCQELEGWLVKRGYPRGMVADQIGRAKVKDRNALLDFEREEKKDGNKRPVLVLTYHPALSKRVHDIVRALHPILQCDEEHRNVFPELPLVAFRRAKSLSDILVRAAVPQNTPGEVGC